MTDVFECPVVEHLQSYVHWERGTSAHAVTLIIAGGITGRSLSELANCACPWTACQRLGGLPRYLRTCVCMIAPRSVVVTTSGRSSMFVPSCSRRVRCSQQLGANVDYHRLVVTTERGAIMHTDVHGKRGKLQTFGRPFASSENERLVIPPATHCASFLEMAHMFFYYAENF